MPIYLLNAVLRWVSRKGFLLHLILDLYSPPASYLLYSSSSILAIVLFSSSYFKPPQHQPKPSCLQRRPRRGALGLPASRQELQGQQERRPSKRTNADGQRRMQQFRPSLHLPLALLPLARPPRHHQQGVLPLLPFHQYPHTRNHAGRQHHQARSATSVTTGADRPIHHPSLSSATSGLKMPTSPHTTSTCANTTTNPSPASSTSTAP